MLYWIGILGAVICGGGAVYGHTQAKNGKESGKMLETLFGILAIICAGVAIYADMFGPNPEELKYRDWEVVRAKFCVNNLKKANAGEKVLFLCRAGALNSEYGSWFVKSLKGSVMPEATYFEMPQYGMDPSDEFLTMNANPNFKGKQLERVKAIAKEIKDKLAAENVDPKNFDVVVLADSMPSFLFCHKDKAIGLFSESKLFFCDSNAIDQKWAAYHPKKSANFVGYIKYKSLKEEDYDKGTTGNDEADGNSRYEYHACSTKK